MGNKAQFGKVLLSVARAVDRVQRDEICCGDLTLQQFETLKRISTADKSTLGSVAPALEIDLSTASRNLTRLEKQGYVSKVRDESDARTVILRLTARGSGRSRPSLATSGILSPPSMTGYPPPSERP